MKAFISHKYRRREGAFVSHKAKQNRYDTHFNCHMFIRRHFRILNAQEERWTVPVILYIVIQISSSALIRRSSTMINASYLQQNEYT